MGDVVLTKRKYFHPTTIASTYTTITADKTFFKLLLKLKFKTAIYLYLPRLFKMHSFQ